MEIALADQHIFVLDDRLTPDEIRQRAMDRRTGAFGSGLGNLLQRPKADDIELVNSQHRLEPFWHVAGRALYVYDRARDYMGPARPARSRPPASPTRSTPPPAARPSSSARRSTAVTSSATSSTSTA